MKKMMIIATVVVLVAAAGLAWSLSTPEGVGLSKLKANPERYVGKVKVIALAGRTDANKGLLEIADEKACCTMVLEVPLTTEQQTRQKSEHLYAGTLPEKGAPLEIVGTLRQVGAGYSFRVIRVTSGGKEIIKRV
jgi:hypothetical protein